MQTPDLRGVIGLFIVGVCLIPLAIWKIVDGIIWLVENVNITVG